MSEREELLSKLVEGELAPAESDELCRLLEADEAFRREAAGLVGLSRLIGYAKYLEADRPDLAAGVMRRIAHEDTKSGRFRGRVMDRLDGWSGAAGASSRQRRSAGNMSHRFWLFGSAAAAAAVLLVAWLRSGNKEENTAQAGPILATLSGQGEVLRDSSRQAAAMGLQLQDGDRVETKAAARMTLRYPNGTTVEMNGKTVAEISAGGLTLERGDIYVLATGPMTVNAGQYDEISVLGTAFEVSRPAGATVLRVAEGRVKYGGSGAVITVAALQASRVAPGGSPSAPEAVELARIAPWRGASGESLASGLVGYWKFDEGTGTVARDSSGENNHGTIHGAAWDKGRLGSALRFDSKTDSFVDVGVGPSLTVPDHVTVAMWINVRERPSAGKPYGLLGRSRYYFRNYNLTAHFIGPEPLAWAFTLSTGEFGDTFGDTGEKATGWKDGSPRQDISLGRWYHVAGIISKNDGGRFAFFVDGKPVSDERNAGFASLCTEGSAPLLIGRTNYTFNGLIDDVRIYRRMLSEEEIARLAEGATAGGLQAVR
jgi:anti-sigma factor RsiW